MNTLYNRSLEKKSNFDLGFLVYDPHSHVMWGSEAAASEPLTSSGDPYRTEGVLTLKPAAGNQHPTSVQIDWSQFYFSPGPKWNVCLSVWKLSWKSFFSPLPLSFVKYAFRFPLNQKHPELLWNKNVLIPSQQFALSHPVLIESDVPSVNVFIVSEERFLECLLTFSEQYEALFSFLFHESLLKLSNVLFYLGPSNFFFILKKNVSFDNNK